MPASEKTWREQKLMHAVFGASALLMLVSTIWMFAKDHYREWKEYQRKFHEIESWTIDARNREQLRADSLARDDERVTE